jgi:hypothetical protein
MHCVAVDGYQEICIRTANEFVNAKICPKKATVWSGTKEVVHPSKPCVLGINRDMRSTSGCMLNLKTDCLFSSGEKRDTKRMDVFQRDGSALFFVKHDLFLRIEMDNLRSNLARIWTCFVSIAWYQETCIWMANESVNAKVSPKKRLIGVVPKVAVPPSKPCVFRYQSIDEKHI